MSSPDDAAIPKSSTPEVQAALAAREASVAERERKADERERKADAKDRNQAEREAKIDDRARALKSGTEAVDQLKREQAEVSARQARTAAELEARNRTLLEQENEARAGFARLNSAAREELEASLTKLRAEAQRLQAELDTARREGFQVVAAAVAEERRIRLAAIDGASEELRQRAERQTQEESTRERDRLSRARAEHDAAVAAERERLAQDRRALEAEIVENRAALAPREAALHQQLAQVRWREEEVAGLRAGLEQSIAARAREEVAALQRELEALQSRNERLVRDNAELGQRVDGHEQLSKRFNGNPEAVLRELDEARARASKLELDLLERPSAGDKERLQGLQEQVRTLEAEHVRNVNELNTLRAEQTRWHLGVQELEAQRDRREIAERRIDVLRGEMEKYTVDVNRLRSLYESPEERDRRVKSIEDPWWTEFRLAEDNEAVTELAWLEGIRAQCEASGMHFSKRMLHAFHTSLKSAELSPLTVLAGVSGTGKSELPRLYARFGGLSFLSLAVQPNWDSPQSLFGFFNSVDNRFNATPTLRAMVQAQHPPKHATYKNGLSDRLAIVLLDEMNLAHVEQYFSDLLSRLEQRRGLDGGVSLDIDLGADVSAYRLALGRNVMWVGTMNEDETTKALSDKVVDRANLLHFPRPRTLHSRTKVNLGPEAALLPQATWQRWLTTSSPLSKGEAEPYRRTLEEINGSLERVGRALGHRVWQSVEYYMANHPEVIEARREENPEGLKRAMQRAYEDQLVLKVMPKLRGIETTGDSMRNCLDPIRKRLDDSELGLRLGADFETACRVGYGAFVWNSAAYLENLE